jgi:pimeloyl-ACP methyl ester carboxylesterase
VTALGLLGALLLAWWLLGRRYRVARDSDELHRVATSDGLHVALSRYRPAAPSRRHPVVLCHGVGANRATFDLAPEVSLARGLAAQGYDVWSLELRGYGRSERAAPGDRRYRWTFDDHVLRDVPAALARVRRESGRERVHFIGHSMGGLVLYAHLARGGESIRSGVAIGASLDYSGSSSQLRRIHHLLPLVGWAPAVPLGPLSVLLAPLTGRVVNPIETFNWWLPNFDARLTRRLVAGGTDSIAVGVLKQLRSAMYPGGLRSSDGAFAYCDGLGAVTAPLLALAGDQDRQCPPEAARATVDALGSAERKLVVLGLEGGQASHYGHFDLITGRRAADEVFPIIYDWLAAHDI